MPRPLATTPTPTPTPVPAPAPRARSAAEPYHHRPRRLFLVRESAAAYGGATELDHRTGEHPAADHRTAAHRSGDHPAADHRTGAHRTGDLDATDLDAADLDALEDLGDAIVTLASHIHAATHRLLVLIAEFDHRRGWERDGHRSCAHWLAFRTGIDLGAAREKVRTARALAELPRTSASMARGELSFSQARALTRIASPTNEAELLELARGVTVHHLERMVRGWKGRTRQDEAERERANHEARSFSIFPDADGTYVVRGRLEPEVAAVLMKAVEAASDALFRGHRETRHAAGTRACGSEEREGGSPHRGCGSEEASRREAAQRRADAVGLLAERALAAGFGGAEGEDAPLGGSRAERYQVVLHVDPQGLAAEGDGGGQRGLEDGTRVSGEVGIHFAPVTATGSVHRPGAGGMGRRPSGRLAERAGRRATPGLSRSDG